MAFDPSAAPQSTISREAKHRSAVARSLTWADAAAAHRDYADALLWLQAIEATGAVLPVDYRAKREEWLKLSFARRAPEAGTKVA